MLQSDLETKTLHLDLDKQKLDGSVHKNVLDYLWLLKINENGGNYGKKEHKL